MNNNILPASAVPFPNAYTVDVTPELAEAWLETGKTNRLVSERRIDNFAAQMEAGQWCLNHNGIAFSENGTLLDGLHRLLAVIRSGKTVPMIVVVNEPHENAAAIDSRG